MSLAEGVYIFLFAELIFGTFLRKVFTYFVQWYNKKHKR